jgi:alkaline phosphatase D
LSDIKSIAFLFSTKIRHLGFKKKRISFSDTNTKLQHYSIKQQTKTFTMKKLVHTILIFAIGIAPAWAQIKCGPMVAYTDYREVALWVQTTKPAKVSINYWVDKAPNNKFSTDIVLTQKSNLYATTLLADAVEPGKTYNYQVVVNGKAVKLPQNLSFKTQTLWQYRSEPPMVKFAFGSCNFVNEEAYDRPGKPYGSGYEIFESIAKAKPDFMLWTGDNTYYREVDFGTKTGMQRRMSHTRSLPQMQQLLGQCSHYAIWDDHDYGPNNSDRSYVLKNEALEVFNEYWPMHARAFVKEGVTTTFDYADIQFFMLDDFWWKAPTEGKDQGDRGDYLGQKQLNWLIDALTYSKATFKFIVCGGQVINSSRIFENMSMSDAERAKLIEEITKRQISGVIFISGDRHHSIIHKLTREGAYPLYDFTVSPLTSGTSKPIAKELENDTIQKDYIFTDKAFGIIEVSGSRKDRVLKFILHNSKGEAQWTKELRASDLK